MTTRDQQIRSAILEALRAKHISVHEKDFLMLLTGYGPSPWPSHETIADRCGCSVSTVKRGLSRLKSIGWVSWDRTYRRSGWRVVRGSNRYRLHPLAGPYARRSTAHRERRMKTSIKTGIEKPVSWQDREQARAALAAIAAERGRKLVGMRPTPSTCRISAPQLPVSARSPDRVSLQTP